MSDRSPLREALDTAIDEAVGNGAGKMSMKDLTVLAVANDPFRIDTPAGHRDGAWLANNADRLLGPTRRIHLRGLHYALVTDAPAKPNGEPYRNTDPDWTWLQEKAADAARWLGYIAFERITDKRNDAPVVRTFERSTPWPYLSTSIQVEIPDASEIEPRVGVLDFSGVQPFKLVMVGEKSSLDETLSPIAQSYESDLYLPTGEMSDTLIHQIAKSGADDGRPLVVLYFSDADPAGWQMPISVARKLQALRVGFFPELDVRLYRVALTPDQVREYGLPSTPLKETERRADAWRQAMGTEQTEIDALASLRPDLLRQIARDAVDCFYDRTLDRRVRQARQEWMQRAQAIIDERVDAEQLDRLRTEAQAKLAELRSEIDAINNAMRLDVTAFSLPEPVVPDADIEGLARYGVPLLDSAANFAAQSERLIHSKAYRNGGGSE